MLGNGTSTQELTITSNTATSFTVDSDYSAFAAEATNYAIRLDYYYHTNVQGNVVAISDDTGTVRETFVYDIYGRLTAATAWDGSATVSVVDGDE